MEIIDIKLSFKGYLLAEIKFDSGKIGTVRVLKNKLDSALNTKTQQRILNLLREKGYKWLESRFFEEKRKRDVETDEYLITVYKENMAELKEVWHVLKGFLFVQEVA